MEGKCLLSYKKPELRKGCTRASASGVFTSQIRKPTRFLTCLRRNGFLHSVVNQWYRINVAQLLGKQKAGCTFCTFCTCNSRLRAVNRRLRLKIKRLRLNDRSLLLSESSLWSGNSRFLLRIRAHCYNLSNVCVFVSHLL